MHRRTFLIRASSAIAVTSTPMPPLQALAAKRAAGPLAVPEEGAGLSPEQWRTLDAVQVHLFPSEPDAPGARDVGALTWVHFVLSDPKIDPADREFIKAGVLRLQEIAAEEHGAPFLALASEQREAVLRRLEATPDGARWITSLLNYILEALLTDPVYGGNPKGIGWKWLEHRPGSLRPTAEKRYFLL